MWSKNPVNSRLRKLPEFNLSDAVLFFFGGVGFFLDGFFSMSLYTWSTSVYLRVALWMLMELR
mgnify:CR=1 FL=1